MPFRGSLHIVVAPASVEAGESADAGNLRRPHWTRSALVQQGINKGVVFCYRAGRSPGSGRACDRRSYLVPPPVHVASSANKATHSDVSFSDETIDVTPLIDLAPAVALTTADATCLQAVTFCFGYRSNPSGASPSPLATAPKSQTVTDTKPRLSADAAATEAAIVESLRLEVRKLYEATVQSSSSSGLYVDVISDRGGELSRDFPKIANKPVGPSGPERVLSSSHVEQLADFLIKRTLSSPGTRAATALLFYREPSFDAIRDDAEDGKGARPLLIVVFLSPTSSATPTLIASYTHVLLAQLKHLATTCDGGVDDETSLRGLSLRGIVQLISKFTSTAQQMDARRTLWCEVVVCVPQRWTVERSSILGTAESVDETVEDNFPVETSEVALALLDEVLLSPDILDVDRAGVTTDDAAAVRSELVAAKRRISLLEGLLKARVSSGGAPSSDAAIPPSIHDVLFENDLLRWRCAALEQQQQLLRNKLASISAPPQKHRVSAEAADAIKLSPMTPGVATAAVSPGGFQPGAFSERRWWWTPSQTLQQSRQWVRDVAAASSSSATDDSSDASGSATTTSTATDDSDTAAISSSSSSSSTSSTSEKDYDDGDAASSSRGATLSLMDYCIAALAPFDELGLVVGEPIHPDRLASLLRGVPWWRIRGDDDDVASRAIDILSRAQRRGTQQGEAFVDAASVVRVASGVVRHLLRDGAARDLLQCLLQGCCWEPSQQSVERLVEWATAFEQVEGRHRVVERNRVPSLRLTAFHFNKGSPHTVGTCCIVRFAVESSDEDGGASGNLGDDRSVVVRWFRLSRRSSTRDSGAVLVREADIPVPNASRRRTRTSAPLADDAYLLTPQDVGAFIVVEVTPIMGTALCLPRKGACAVGITEVAVEDPETMEVRGVRLVVTHHRLDDDRGVGEGDDGRNDLAAAVACVAVGDTVEVMYDTSGFALEGPSMIRWFMASSLHKHAPRARLLEDVAPHRSLVVPAQAAYRLLIAEVTPLRHADGLSGPTVTTSAWMVLPTAVSLRNVEAMMVSLSISGSSSQTPLSWNPATALRAPKERSGESCPQQSGPAWILLSSDIEVTPTCQDVLHQLLSTVLSGPTPVGAPAHRRAVEQWLDHVLGLSSDKMPAEFATHSYQMRANTQGIGVKIAVTTNDGSCIKSNPSPTTWRDIPWSRVCAIDEIFVPSTTRRKHSFVVIAVSEKSRGKNPAEWIVACFSPAANAASAEMVMAMRSLRSAFHMQQQQQRPVMERDAENEAAAMTTMVPSSMGALCAQAAQLLVAPPPEEAADRSVANRRRDDLVAVNVMASFQLQWKAAWSSDGATSELSCESGCVRFPSSAAAVLTQSLLFPVLAIDSADVW